MSGQNIRKVLTFHAKQSNEFVIVPQLLEMHVSLILYQNIWKVYHFVSKYLKSIWFWTKTFEIYWISTQRNSKSFVFVHKSFKKYLFWKTFEKYLIPTKNTETVSYAYSKHSKSISFWSKTFDTHQIFLPETYKKTSDIGLIRKVLNFV